MRSFIQAAVFLCTTVSALVVPPTPPSINDIASVAGSTVPEHVVIRFSASCKGCFIGTEDGLELELDIPESHAECTDVLPSLNGLPLAPSEGGDVANGNLVFKTNLSNGLGEREIHASWERACVNGEASLLSVNVHGVLGLDHVKDVSGFAVSFKQQGSPTVLRLQDRPIKDLTNVTMLDEWLLSPVDADLKFIVQSDVPSMGSTDLLEEEYRKLELLKNKLSEMHHQVMRQEGKIFMMIKEDFNACNGVKCLLQTAVKKAPDFMELFKSLFRHHTKGMEMDGFNCSWFNSAEEPTGSGKEIASIDNLLPLPPPPPPPAADDLGDVHTGVDADMLPPPPPPPPPPDFDRFPPESTEEAPPSGFDGPPPGFKPPFAPGDHPHPPFRFPPGVRPHHGPPPGFKPPFFPKEDLNGAPSMPHGHRPHRRPHMPHPAPIPPYHLLILVVAVFVMAVVIMGILFKLHRIYMSNPRRRADCAARIEEHRTRRLYRRAACKYKFRQMFSRFRRRRSSGTEDYEEKRAMLRNSEDSHDSNDVMRADINSLRRAHEIVGELMRAEEGRTRLYHEANFGTESSQMTAAGEMASISNRSESSLRTLPPYAPPPPRYEEELQGDMEVVDGFRYSPSNSAVTMSSSASSFVIDDEATESSVVDCRSRISFETESVGRSRKSLELAGDRMARNM